MKYSRLNNGISVCYTDKSCKHCGHKMWQAILGDNADCSLCAWCKLVDDDFEEPMGHEHVMTLLKEEYRIANDTDKIKIMAAVLGNKNEG